MKIIDKINRAIQENRPFFSFEYFPPKTESGVQNLYERMDRMIQLGPEFVDCTWGAGGGTSALTLEISAFAQKFCGVDTMMHMTCTNMKVEELTNYLYKAKMEGIQNILALRGDPPRGEDWKKIEGGFAHAVDLVKHIRKLFGDYFGICVAGYPEKHLEADSYEQYLMHLKEKVDAGADFIITQLFYDADIYLKFVKDCRNIGITVPIIPGIMTIQSYAGFVRMTTLCKTYVPKDILDALEPVKDNDEAVKTIGVDICIKLCRKLLDNGAPCLHFYTLNLEKSVIKILEGLPLIENCDSMIRKLPWKKTAHKERKQEDVRPIFWALWPKSYIARTESWDEFPNGRWGDSRSPAFGELADMHLTTLHRVKSEEVIKAWGAPTSEQDVYKVFADYCRGVVQCLPWTDSPLARETEDITDQLVQLNEKGFLTINSQPRVNSAHSTDKKYGWGPSGGYVYQKAYIEFFTTATNLNAFKRVAAKHSSITFMAVNLAGDVLLSSPGAKKPNAVTWGVFPEKEIVQPTVVEFESFIVWKGEAFALWQTHWQSTYPKDSESYKLLQYIHDTYYLVNVVENDYVERDIFSIFTEVVEEVKKSTR